MALELLVDGMLHWALARHARLVPAGKLFVRDDVKAGKQGVAGHRPGYTGICRWCTSARSQRARKLVQVR